MVLVIYEERGDGVDLVFYSPVSGSSEERLQRVIDSVIPGREEGVCRTIDDLSERLLQPKNDLAVALLLAEKREDIEELLSVSNLFRNTRIILVAPDRAKETIAAAHLLRPRLLTYSDGDFTDVFTVLTKIIADHHNPTGIGGR
jgi:hypothetical protein